MPSKKRNGGRRAPKFRNKAIRDTVVSALAVGSTVESACITAGIGETTFYEWVAVGEAYRAGNDHRRMPRLIADRELLAQFAEDVTRATRSAEIEALAVINDAITDPRVDMRVRTQNAQWYLERRFPERWGRRDTTTVTGGGAAIRIEYTGGGSEGAPDALPAWVADYASPFADEEDGVST